MRPSTYMAAIALAFAAAGCQTEDKPDVVSKALKQITVPKGSVVQYAEVPRGTTFIPGQGMGITSTRSFPDDGYLLFIDEQPEYDWAHGFRLVFVPKTSGKPDVFFRGSPIPDYSFRKPEGSTVTGWRKY